MGTYWFWIGVLLVAGTYFVRLVKEATVLHEDANGPVERWFPLYGQAILLIAGVICLFMFWGNAEFKHEDRKLHAFGPFAASLNVLN